MRRTLLAALVVTFVCFTSGCGALLLVGAGGTAGYMIKKGEDSGGGKGGTTKKSGDKTKKNGALAPQPVSETEGTR